MNSPMVWVRDLKDLQDHQESQETTDPKETPDYVELKEMQAHQELMEPQVFLDNQGPQDHQDEEEMAVQTPTPTE